MDAVDGLGPLLEKRLCQASCHTAILHVAGPVDITATTHTAPHSVFRVVSCVDIQLHFILHMRVTKYLAASKKQTS